MLNQLKKVVVAGSLLMAPVLTTGLGAASAATTQYYTVKYNDTLYKIAKSHHISLSALEKANPQIRNFDVIWPGMVIKIPSQNTTSGQNAAGTSAYADQVAALVNQERAKAGLKPLKVSQPLSAMARDKAIDMYVNNYFDHNSPTYGSPFDMMSKYGISYSYAGENIAKGQQSPQEVMTAWMNSQGHRANILNPHYTTIGVAYYKGEWVQEFVG
jgi:uncharacterized YkwD family protein